MTLLQGILPLREGCLFNTYDDQRVKMVNLKRKRKRDGEKSYENSKH